MRGGPNLDGHEQEPRYVRSVRRHCEAGRREILVERRDYHLSMIERHRRVLERLIERHREGAEECERALGGGSPGEEAAM